MTHTPNTLPPLPQPWDYCYEWNGPYGTRKFSVAPHNGRKPDATVQVYTADQMQAYARASVVAGSCCVPWPGYLTADGYGRMCVRKGKSIRAHVAVWEKVNGPIPAGMVLDHLCRNRSCVNPAHLEVVSPRENTMRGDGPTAINARKSNCIRGHDLVGENLGITQRGRRYCRECQRQHHRNYVARKKEAQR